jgi:tetratricopeptide (TPR) repeat protein
VSSRLFAAVMAVLLVLYLVLVMQLALRLLAVDEPIAKGLGVALLVLPLVGAWALFVEIRFGFRSERLGRALAAEGEYPLQDLPRSASGRVDRAAADAAFGGFQAEAESDPERWQSWYRLGLAYDACGDRRRARAAIRRSISVYRDPAHTPIRRSN